MNANYLSVWPNVICTLYTIICVDKRAKPFCFLLTAIYSPLYVCVYNVAVPASLNCAFALAFVTLFTSPCRRLSQSKPRRSSVVVVTRGFAPEPRSRADSVTLAGGPRMSGILTAAAVWLLLRTGRPMRAERERPRIPGAWVELPTVGI